MQLLWKIRAQRGRLFQEIERETTESSNVTTEEDMILVRVQDKDDNGTVESSPETSNEDMALATRLDSDIWI